MGFGLTIAHATTAALADDWHIGCMWQRQLLARRFGLDAMAMHHREALPRAHELRDGHGQRRDIGPAAVVAFEGLRLAREEDVFSFRGSHVFTLRSRHSAHSSVGKVASPSQWSRRHFTVPSARTSFQRLAWLI